MSTTRAEAEPRPILPLAMGLPGRYQDDRVVVDRARGDRGRPLPGWVRTAHFEVGRQGHRIHVVHRLPNSRLDDDLTGLLADELFYPGWVTGADAFERIFAGVVMSSLDDPLDGWELFYRNTLDRLLQPSTDLQGSHGSHGTIDGYRPVYRRAISLVPPGEVLELGCCFGFLALQLAARGDVHVVASDVTAGTVSLLDAMRRRLGADVRTIAADAARVPLTDRHVDTVLAVHLLEHLNIEDGTAVMAEALRLARHRVVIAVPFESEPSVELGHVRVFDLESLAGLAVDLPPGWRKTVSAHHGGWLVIDRM